MPSHQHTPEGKDPVLWKIATKRAGFKRHFSFYIVINFFLWGIWYFTGHHFAPNGMPWPAWCTIGWGIGITSHYIRAYISLTSNTVENEYQKLQNRQNK